MRYHSDSRSAREASAGLNRLTGRQLAAVRASLPAPTTRALLVVPSRELHDDDELVLQVGQVRESAERARPQGNDAARNRTAEDARNAMVAGLLASGISVNGLQPSHNPQVASQMFTTATTRDPGDVRRLAGADAGR